MLVKDNTLAELQFPARQLRVIAKTETELELEVSALGDEVWLEPLSVAALSPKSRSDVRTLLEGVGYVLWRC